MEMEEMAGPKEPWVDLNRFPFPMIVCKARDVFFKTDDGTEHDWA